MWTRLKILCIFLPLIVYHVGNMHKADNFKWHFCPYDHEEGSAYLLYTAVLMQNIITFRVFFSWLFRVWLSRVFIVKENKELKINLGLELKKNLRCILKFSWDEPQILKLFQREVVLIRREVQVWMLSSKQRLWPTSQQNCWWTISYRSWDIRIWNLFGE